MSAAIPVHTTSCTPNPDGTCAICGDEACPGIVESLDNASKTAEVALQLRGGTQVTTVAVDLLDEVSIGDTVMVHLGFAIARVDGRMVASGGAAATKRRGDE